MLALSITLFLYSFGYGGITSFAALYADANHVVPKEVFFTTFAIVVLCTRPFLGPLGDRIGYRRVFLPCLVLIVCGLALLASHGTQVRASSSPPPSSAPASAPRTPPLPPT